MTFYPPNMLMRDAREIYFERSGFGDNGGYDERWIKVKVWKFPIWLPNVENRRRAVRLHDLHHVLTEYATTWQGEAEISAWEVGSGGLGRYWAGWILDLMNVGQGLIINPRGVYRAFMRGRQTQNLFDREFTEELLHRRVGELRSQLLLDTPLRDVNLGDKAAFGWWTIISVAVYLVAIALPFLPVVFIGLIILYR